MAPAPPAPLSGVGLGLRWEFVGELLQELPPAIDFLEVSPENYLQRGGYYPEALARLRERYPVITHGLTMSLGGTDPLDAAYLASLRGFVREVGSPWHSDHVCFGAEGGRVLHDLLPVAFTTAAANRVADRVRRAQDALAVPVAIENISYYLHPGKAQMSEPEFLSLVCEKAECGLMFDVNNAYVNSQNFGFDPGEWMRAAPLERVVQMHVAGGEWFDEGEERLLIDTHGADVPDPVLALFERALARTGAVPVVLERDQAIPPLSGLVSEIEKIRAIYARGLGSR